MMFYQLLRGLTRVLAVISLINLLRAVLPLLLTSQEPFLSTTWLGSSRKSKRREHPRQEKGNLSKELLFTASIKMKASSFFSARPAPRQGKLLSLHFITGKPFLVSSESLNPQEECCRGEPQCLHVALPCVVVCSRDWEQKRGNLEGAQPLIQDCTGRGLDTTGNWVQTLSEMKAKALMGRKSEMSTTNRQR